MPGLLALIGFSCLNNFLGGAFMALMDAYGLSMMSVQAWGLLWGALSAVFIVGGLMVARTGLGSKPLRLLLLINLVLWSVTALFPLQASIVMLAVGHGRLHAPGARTRRRPSRPSCSGWCPTSGRAGCSASRRASSWPRRR